MKILLVNKFNYLRGGAEKYFLDLAKLLQKNNIDVAKFCMRHPKNLPDKYEKYFVSYIDFNKFRIKNLFKYISRILWSFEATKKFEKLILDFKPDIIHIHNIYHQISPSIIRTAKKYNLPVIMHLHDYKLICPNYKLFVNGSPCYHCKGGKYYNCVLRCCFKESFLKSLLAMVEMYLHHKILKIYNKIDLFIAPSEFMKDMCVKFGISENKIKVVYNFVEVQETKLPIGNLVSNMESYLLYFGRLSEEKGIPVLLDAMKKVNRDVKLKIVGSGPEEEKLKIKSEKHALSKVEGLKAGNRIEFVGPKYGEELNNLIINAKAIVIPSVWPENMPLSLLESMSAGKAVVASRIGGIPEIIKNNENGILFMAGDSDSLADKINQLREININNMGINAMVTMKNFSPKKHFDEIIKIYNCYVK